MILFMKKKKQFWIFLFLKWRINLQFYFSQSILKWRRKWKNGWKSRYVFFLSNFCKVYQILDHSVLLQKRTLLPGRQRQLKGPSSASVKSKKNSFKISISSTFETMSSSKSDDWLALVFVRQKWMDRVTRERTHIKGFDWTSYIYIVG